MDTAEPDTVMNNVIGFIMVDKTHTFKDVSVVNSLPSQLVVAVHVSTKEVNPDIKCTWFCLLVYIV